MSKPEMKPIVGAYFHTFRDDGKVENQGKVIGELFADTYEVQLFSWIDGEPTTKKTATLQEMDDWRFYETRKEWVAAGDKLWLSA